MTPQKVLVTGADGFIGSHLVEALIKSGSQVKAFVYYNSFNNWGWLESLDKSILKEIEVVSGDIRDSSSVEFATNGVDMVFHLAALIGIPYSYQAPNSYIDTNITGTLNILQSARKFDVKKVLVTSTSEVYGTALTVPIDETHPRQGQSPYSATKIGADALADSFFRSFNVPVTIVRPFNTYGPRQSARAIIPTVISQLLDGKSEIKVGSLHPTRDLVFVKDTANGFIKIAQSTNTIGEEINIATGKEISIQLLVEKIISIINPAAKIIHDGSRIRPKNSEVERLIGSTLKLEKLVNWTPETSLDDGLIQTIEWFKATQDAQNYKSDIYNV